ncbi:MAG: hypothetical protein ACREEZ_01580 [Stellaceae bacterium]
MISVVRNQQRPDLPEQPGASSRHGLAGQRLIWGIVGVGIAQVPAIGAMIWAATEAISRARSHL